MGSDTVGQESSQKLPLGYLLKTLDVALTGYVDELLRQRYQLGRSHWQLMRTVATYPGVDLEQIARAASVFFDEAELRQVLDDLIRRGWLSIGNGDGEVRLTPDGELGFQAMARTQDGSSARLRRGISDADYDSVLNVLMVMIGNIQHTNPDDPEIP